ncbi:sensor histidine kinase [Paenibacillus sp. FJAT-27812]|uniref:sensor histidine kinase n=1 Tax=Paenibacillus sp. FJAT-27812 TaxID=1684143 RepID=UPI0006A7DB46|nr:HAMP domain-containing sensor histidine kinase [Paenibacillus sp. FJAT-27812]
MIQSIKVKFLIGLLVIFVASLLLLHHFVLQIIESSNETTITQDLNSIKKNSNVYVRQTFMINHYSHDEIYFEQMSKELVADLNKITSSSVAVYSVDGELLAASDKAAFKNPPGDDFKHALKGETAYTITHQDKISSIYFAYPVVIDGDKIGILRFAKDASLLYGHSQQILNVIMYVTIAIFALGLLLCFALFWNITLPIVKMTKVSTEVIGGNLNVHIALNRKDELGKLAHNFNLMIEKIRLQIGKIEKDRDQLKELNRHRKQFYDNVTHELKTPLTSIMGYAQMIKENGQSDEVFFEKGIDHIADESARLHEMVLQLLELSKETDSKSAFESIEAGAILESVCEGMAFKAQKYKKNILCEVEGQLMIEGSATKLRQLFINLVDNAIKYSDTSSEIIVNAAQTSEFVQISVFNQGEVIPPEHLERIFEPFFREHGYLVKEIGSRGLGLSICKAIVEEHQGTIQIRSENGETSVLVQIPRIETKQVNV